MKALSVTISNLWPMLKVFQKRDLDIWPLFWQIASTLVPQKGLSTRNTCVKYKGCLTYQSKVMPNDNPLPHMPILGSYNSAVNKDM